MEYRYISTFVIIVLSKRNHYDDPKTNYSPKRSGLTAHLFEKFKEKTLIRTTKKESI